MSYTYGKQLGISRCVQSMELCERLENLRKRQKIFGNVRKSSEKLENIRKRQKIFGNVRKYSETLENIRKR